MEEPKDKQYDICSYGTYYFSLCTDACSMVDEPQLKDHMLHILYK